MVSIDAGLVETVGRSVEEARLVDTAVRLIEVPSPTCEAGAAADRLTEILAADGFAVERPAAGWPSSPAVVVRWGPGGGRVLQLNGHLDTVHLPFVPPRVEGGVLRGSGASDMKAGIAINVEVLRVLRDADLLPRGGILLNAHDHHEHPWGDGRQLAGLIEQGYTGDAVLIPEYLCDCVPVAGRGQGIFEIVVRRDGEPVHEVMRPPGTPDVLAAGADVAVRLRHLRQRLAANRHPHAGADSAFVGVMAGGEVFNQSPAECRLQGTRRWIAPGGGTSAEAELRELLAEVAAETGTTIDLGFQVTGDAFRLDASDPVVAAFQAAHVAVAGQALPPGGKRFVDDGNRFHALAGIPALTHGPAATGAHTADERVPTAELVRVARVYALTAAAYCGSG